MTALDLEDRASCCDCCGELKTDCRDQTWRGMDVHICPECRGADDDEAADRGDFEFHRDYDA
jgi:hypothetical protein